MLSFFFVNLRKKIAPFLLHTYFRISFLHHLCANLMHTRSSFNATKLKVSKPYNIETFEIYLHLLLLTRKLVFLFGQNVYLYQNALRSGPVTAPLLLVTMVVNIRRYLLLFQVRVKPWKSSSLSDLRLVLEQITVTASCCFYQVVVNVFRVVFVSRSVDNNCQRTIHQSVCKAAGDEVEQYQWFIRSSAGKNDREKLIVTHARNS